MKKLLKLLGVTIISLIFLMILSMIFLTVFVSPNRYKPFISEQIQKQTGLKINIDGNLSWSFLPSLGIKVGHLSIQNPEGFAEKTFAEMQNATINIKLLPLLHSQIESSGIRIEGLKLNLIKNAKGQANWEIIQKNNGNKEKSTKTNSTLGLAILGIQFVDGSIQWVDEVAKKNILIDHLNMHAKDISLTKSFPLKINFTLSSKNPDLSAEIALSSQISMDLSKQIFYLNETSLDQKVVQAKNKIHTTSQGNIVIDNLQQTIKTENLHGSINDINWQGTLAVKEFSNQPKMVGEFKVDPFDGKKFLNSIGQNTDSLSSLKPISANFHLTYNAQDQAVLNGNMTIQDVQASKIKLSNVMLKAHLKNTILEISPIRADLYEGKLEALAKINFAATPKISLEGQIKNTKIQALLNDLGMNEKLDVRGRGDVNFKMATTLDEAMVKNLNGSAQVIVSDGAIQGVDIGYYLDSAYAMVGGPQVSSENTGQTPFGKLTASALIQNGIITNNDFYLDSARFDTKGYGTINLVEKNINYHLQTQAKEKQNQKDNAMNLYHFPVPILITGDFNKPKIRVDQEVVIRALAERQIKKTKEKLKDRIQIEINDKNIPDEAKSLISNFLGQ